jgi:DNA-binding NarL/FixJ family response regulator
MAKILIADDVPALRQHASTMIHARVSASIEFREAENGLDAVKLFRTYDPDMIVMDISMPEMNGIKAAQQIWSENKRMKILFWSQYHREVDIRELAKIVPDEAVHGYAIKTEPDDKFVSAVSDILFFDNPYIDPIVRNLQIVVSHADKSLSETEHEMLMDICLGLTDRAISTRRHISVRGVQARLGILMKKLMKRSNEAVLDATGMEIYNPRTRIVLEALKRQLIDPDQLQRLDAEIDEWLLDDFDYKDD